MLNAENAAHGDVATEEKTVPTLYMESLRLIERLHRRLLDVIKDEFERRGRNDVNSVQALLIYNIGDAELTAGELKTRGYYLGSNVSYNLKKLVDMQYISHERSKDDRRAVKVSLTEKGHEVRAIIDELYEKHLTTIEPVGDLHVDDFDRMNVSLRRLERFWTDQIRFRL